jgi:hypothetical protein
MGLQRLLELRLVGDGWKRNFALLPVASDRFRAGQIGG